MEHACISGTVLGTGDSMIRKILCSQGIPTPVGEQLLYSVSSATVDLI